MSDQSSNIETASAAMEPLFDSTEGLVMTIPPELVKQLADNAAFAYKQMTYGQKTPVTLVVQVNKNSNQTIKPTMTFQDGKTGVYGVVILEIEKHSPRT